MQKSNDSPNDIKCFSYTFNDWSEKIAACNYRFRKKNHEEFNSTDVKSLVQWIDSDIFFIDDYAWVIRIYPFGLFSHDDYIAVTLVLLSNVPVKVNYSITLLNPYDTSVRPVIWSDPEDVMFYGYPYDISYQKECMDELKGMFGHDNEWGSDSFISFDDLHNPSNKYLPKDSLTISMNIHVFKNSITTLSSENTMKDLSEITSSEELISIAKEDLCVDIMRLSKTVARQAHQREMHNAIISHRLQSMACTSTQQPVNEGDVMTRAMTRASSRGQHASIEGEYLSSDITMSHRYTSRLGAAAASITKTFQSSRLIMSLSGTPSSTSSRSRRGHKIAPYTSPLSHQY